MCAFIVHHGSSKRQDSPQYRPSADLKQDKDAQHQGYCHNGQCTNCSSGQNKRISIAGWHFHFQLDKCQKLYQVCNAAPKAGSLHGPLDQTVAKLQQLCPSRLQLYTTVVCHAQGAELQTALGPYFEWPCTAVLVMLTISVN